MTGYSDATIWLIIILLGIGTYLIRFSFLGLFGNRPLPRWVMQHLRYTPVAIIPGLVAPLALFPEATGGAPDPARLLSAAVTLGLGLYTKNVLWAIFGGALALWLGLTIFG